MNRRTFAVAAGAFAVRPLATMAACDDQDEANTAVARRFVEDVLNGGNLDLIAEIGHPDYMPTDEANAPGLEAWKQRLAAARERRAPLIPDFAVVIDELIAADGRVAMRARATGNTSAGKNLEVLMLSLFEFKDGKILRAWDLQDTEAFMAAM